MEIFPHYQVLSTWTQYKYSLTPGPCLCYLSPFCFLYGPFFSLHSLCPSFSLHSVWSFSLSLHSLCPFSLLIIFYEHFSFIVRVLFLIGIMFWKLSGPNHQQSPAMDLFLHSKVCVTDLSKRCHLSKEKLSLLARYLHVRVRTVGWVSLCYQSYNIIKCPKKSSGFVINNYWGFFRWKSEKLSGNIHDCLILPLAIPHPSRLS